MYTISVEAGFSAVHSLRLPEGAVEPTHGHDWAVRAYFSTPDLDATDMVLDFEQASGALQATLGQWHHKDLNKLQAFDGMNPTAETVAKNVFASLLDAGLATIRRVEVTEAPGCVASYEP